MEYNTLNCLVTYRLPYN